MEKQADANSAIVKEFRISEKDQRGAQRRQQRLKMLSAVLFSYVFTSVLMAGYAMTGGGSLLVPLYYLICGILSGASFFLLYYSGWTDQFKDHYLTALQMYCTAALMLSFIYFAPAFSYFLLNALFIAVSFGAMRLERRRAIIALVVIGCVLFAVGWAKWGQLLPAPTQRLQTATLFLSFVSTLGRVMMIGLYNSTLRLKLERKNVELAAFSKRVERIASYDELTGIFNRRQLRHTIEEWIHNFSETGRGMSLVMLDLDHFKRVNDEYGHPVGDAVIKAFADIASSRLRATDIIGRYGGEEFIIILHNEDAHSTRMVAERVRASTEKHDWSQISPGLSVTVSAGMATYCSGQTVDEIIKCADVALYRAKEMGRNCLVAD